MLTDGCFSRSRISLGSGLQPTNNGTVLSVNSVQRIFRVLVAHGLVFAPELGCTAAGKVGRRWTEGERDALLHGRG